MAGTANVLGHPYDEHMGYFRFHRSIKILPGIRWNLGKRSSSLSLGGRGFHYTLGPSGTRTTVGLPGTGLSYTSVDQRKRAEKIPHHEVDNAMEWSRNQEETFHLEYPDRLPDELPATPEQLGAIHNLVCSISGADLHHLGCKQADFLIHEINQEKKRFTERKVHEYLDRQSRPSTAGCMALILLLVGVAYAIIHLSH